MRTILNKTLTPAARFLQETLGFAVVFTVALTVVAAASAWSGPPGAPPAGAVPPPINVSPTTQIKVGDIGANTLVADQICLTDECRASWPDATPNCRICVRAGVMNGAYGTEQCTKFNEGAAYSGREAGFNGRGTTIDAQVLCP